MVVVVVVVVVFWGWVFCLFVCLFVFLLFYFGGCFRFWGCFVYVCWVVLCLVSLLFLCVCGGGGGGGGLLLIFDCCLSYVCKDLNCVLLTFVRYNKYFLGITLTPFRSL